MSLIQIKNLSFTHDGSYLPVFENLSLQFDTNYKTALIGRNARGKTTLLKILNNELDYQGEIIKKCACHYFPYHVKNENLLTIDICYEIAPLIEQWQLERELRLLEVDPYDIFYRPYCTLSKGEQTKVMLAVLFFWQGDYLLIDEPTNHLDQQSRHVVANYLKKQKGFLLVSHDREFIDICCDHVIAMNPTSIDIEAGNFSSWYQQKMKADEKEIEKNIKLKKEINRLEKSRRQTENWSHLVEKSKRGAADKGYVGHMAAKMMKRSKNIEKRKNETIQEKKDLLKDVEEYEDLSMHPLDYFQNYLIRLSHVSLGYDDRILIPDLSLDICVHDRILLKGKNGCGKSSLIKLILSQDKRVDKSSHLKIAYVPQDCSYLKGKLNDYINEHEVDETLVKTILRKFGFRRDDFEILLENMSEGQKKKVALAIAIATPAHLYIFDEPLNYLDIFARIQLEKVVLKDQPTMLFVEHDTYFQEKIMTKVVNFDELFDK